NAECGIRNVEYARRWFLFRIPNSEFRISNDPRPRRGRRPHRRHGPATAPFPLIEKLLARTALDAAGRVAVEDLRRRARPAGRGPPGSPWGGLSAPRPGPRPGGGSPIPGTGSRPSAFPRPARGPPPASAPALRPFRRRRAARPTLPPGRAAPASETGARAPH